jgi:ankyrin repeat protein
MINAMCGLADAGILAEVLTTRSTKAGRTPLHLACQKGNASIVKALIDAGDMVGVARRHNLDRRTVLVDGFNDGTWGKKDENGSLSLLENEDATPMHVTLVRLACECDNEKVVPRKGQEDIDTCYDIIKLLIGNGANIDALDRSGACALHLAVAYNLLKVADILLYHDASLLIGGKFIGTGNNALHHAVEVGNHEMVTKIVTHAGKNLLLDIDAFGSGGWSALGLAVRVGNVSVVDTLLAAGANGNLPMGNGKSPLEIARVNKRACIIEAIRKREQISA